MAGVDYAKIPHCEMFCREQPSDFRGHLCGYEIPDL